MLLVGAFDRLLRELVQHVAAGRIGVSGQNVAVTIARNAQLSPPAVEGHGCGVHANGVNRDLVCQQHLQYLGIAGAAAVFLSVADHEDDLAVLRAAGAPGPAPPSGSHRSARTTPCVGVCTCAPPGHRLAVGRADPSQTDRPPAAAPGFCPRSSLIRCNAISMRGRVAEVRPLG